MVRTPGQRAGLSRPVVLAAARDLLASHGLDGVTMRAVAERLSVAPNALYSHVPSKTALVDDLLDEALSHVTMPGVRATPAGGLNSVMLSTYDVLVANPDLVPVFLTRQGSRGPNAQALGEVMTGLLGRAGVVEPAAGAALRVLIVYTIGFAAFVVSSPLAPDVALTLAELRDNFSRGLGWLIAGVLQGDR